jgi:polyphosphate kinase
MTEQGHGPVNTRYTEDRELSWLKFDERVMEEAWDDQVPLFERLKFASIFTSNLDEFFMIRVGSISDMSLLKEAHRDKRSGMTPKEQLKAIFRAVAPLYKQRDKLMEQLETRLRSCNICRLSYEEIDSKERKQLERYWRDYVQPVLSPMVVNPHHPFPHLPSKHLCVVVGLQAEGETLCGLIPIPKTLAPFYLFPEQGVRYILMEQIILAYANRLFERYTITERCVIAVTRNGDISPEDEDSEVGDDFRQHMKKVLKKRARLAPVRLEVQGEASEALLSYLCQRLDLPWEQMFRTRSPIDLNYVYALEGKLPAESRAALCNPPYTPCWPGTLVKGEKLIPQIARQDVLLYYPYHSMEPFLQLVREAANDPAVLSIKITIYRLAGKSKLVEYLAAAAENGKDVTVLMELRARFDEQNNIAWAEWLEQAGCTVLYGFEDVKVHSKICLITRRSKGGVTTITQIGTGNYNEKTAKLYSDLCLMTANAEIGADATAFFQNMATSNLYGTYQHLLVAPHGFKNRMLALMDEEIAKCRAGKEGRIFIKVNSITDRELIDKLAEASEAGVKITMNVRGICCIRPGVPECTENIRVFSIVGRYLEHARVFAFGAGGDMKMYLGSPDFMTRNTERRVEIACPVLDMAIQRQLKHDLQLLCEDRVKARELDSAGDYHKIACHGEALLNAQERLMKEAQQEAEQAEAARKAASERPKGVLPHLIDWLRSRRR